MTRREVEGSYPHPVVRLGSVRTADGLIAVGFVLAAGLESTLETWGQPQQLVFALPHALLLFPLWIRRRRPLLAISIPSVGFAAGSLAQAHLPSNVAPPANVVVPILALVFLIYSLGVHGTKRELLLGVPQPLLVVTVIDLVNETGHRVQAALPFFALFIAGAPLVAGLLVRSRNRLVARLRQQERQIQAENATRVAAARSRERLEMAARLQATLLGGIEGLIDAIGVAQGGDGDDRLEAVARIETQARDLLARTRTVIVGLAAGDAQRRADPAQRFDAEGAATRPRGDPPPSRDFAGIDPAPWAALLAATFTVGLLTEARSNPAGHVPALEVLAACLAVAVPLALIWYRPLLLTAIVWASAILADREVLPISSVLAVFALALVPSFAVSLLERRRRALLGLAICLLGAGAGLGSDSLPFVALSWLAGWALRDRSVLAHSLDANNLLLAKQQAAIVERAILDERTDAAREVHDAVGHSLTVIALQAAAARRIWTSDKGRAEDALATIAQVASGGLNELRLLGPVGTPPGLDAIAELVANARVAGLHTVLQIGAGVADLTPDAQFAVYRVVQEALTNVLKHAPGASAEVTLRRASSGFELRVANTTAQLPHSLSEDPGGRGLQGMRERVEVCGGQLSWGRRDDGFTVRALFPVGS